MRFPANIVLLLLWTACVAKDCNEPPPRKDTEILSGSWLAESYKEGTKAMYKCRPGYRTLGAIVMICRDGQWESLFPSRICQRKPCGHPGDTDFGSFHLVEGTKFEYGAKVVYTCNEGYQLLGEVDYRECEPEGWTNDIPKCEVVKCLPVTEPENGRIASALESDQEYTFGQVIRFECNSGLMLKGSKEIHCSTNGVWSDDPPKCVEIYCETPTILNGNALTQKRTFRNNERLQYQCNPGFEHSERGDAVCTSFGWSPVPACKEVTCSPPTIKNGVYGPQKNKYRFEDEVIYECKNNLSPSSHGNKIKCTSGGWYPEPTCTLKPCDRVEIKHGKLYERWPYRPSFPASIKEYFYYECNENFVPPTKEHWGKITCTKDGWLPKVHCLRECTLNSLRYGQIINWKRSYYQGDIATIKCFTDYSLENGQSTVTCTENGWVPPAICDKVKICSKIHLEIENGFFSETGNTYISKKAQYRCKPGYLTEHGKETGSITCLEDGWSAIPKCIKSCYEPVFVNARGKNVSTWFKLNDQVEYECHSGYETKTGSTTGSIVCGDNGWSDRPVCYEKECTIPKIGRYINVTPKIERQKVGSIVKFNCKNKDSKRVGADSSQCYHFGWSPPFPTCKVQVKSCTLPPELPGGEIKEELKAEYEHNDVVQYACRPRFLMKGAAKVQCIDGQWTPLPVCIEEVRTCGEIPGLDHGSAEPSVPPYHHGDSVNLICEEGFTIVGDRSLTCKKGQWTQLPKCIANDELENCNPPSLVTSQSRQSYRHNETISYLCRKTSENKQSICINGNWEPEVSCEEVKSQNCPPPPQIPNSKNITTTVNYQDGEKISILCEDNFLLQETEEMICKNGKWQSTPHCVEKLPCSQPPPIQHGSIKLKRFLGEKEGTLEHKTYPHGTTLSYVCEAGFRISNEDGIRCHMGTWSSPPQCEGLPCGPPPEISHGFVSQKEDSYRFGEEVTYSCVEGFGINGPPSIKCLGGKWSSPPECINTDCSNLPNFEIAKPIGLTKTSYHSGEQVSYSCPEFYQMDGSNIVQCINSNWIGSPKCRDVSCTDPPTVKNAVQPKKETRYRPHEIVRYECIKPFDLFRSVEVVCLNGTWTKTPQCKDSKGKCGTPPPIDNGDITSVPAQVYAPGSRVQYKCQNSYNLEGRATITCQNGEWTEPPRCLDPCVISEDIMNKHKIQFKWVDEKKLYAPSGDYVEFECKYGYHRITQTPLRTQCIEGKLTYPTCG